MVSLPYLIVKGTRAKNHQSICYSRLALRQNQRTFSGFLPYIVPYHDLSPHERKCKPFGKAAGVSVSCQVMKGIQGKHIHICPFPNFEGTSIGQSHLLSIHIGHFCDCLGKR